MWAAPCDTGRDASRTTAAIFEYFVIPSFRRWSRALVVRLIAATGATCIECQSNDPSLSPMLHEFAWRSAGMPSHAYKGPAGMIDSGVGGFVFGAAYLLSGRNLWAAILAHGFVDTLGVGLLYFGLAS